ncbi:MAG: helix-turn-helix transcriptional regulator [Bacteroidales bacterium]|nr:helix-turn-helix transcriptional regulator [Bacteroidales bacterium]
MLKYYAFLSMINVCINTSSYIISIGLSSVLKELNCNLNVKIICGADNAPFDDCDFFVTDKNIFNLLKTYQFAENTQILIIDDDSNNLLNSSSKNKLFDRLNEIFCSSQKFEQTSDEISEREREIIKLVANGFTNKQIADQLFLSVHTVITHRKNISAKLGIKSISGLTIYAVLNGIIKLKD